MEICPIRHPPYHPEYKPSEYGSSFGSPFTQTFPSSSTAATASRSRCEVTDTANTKKPKEEEKKL